MLTAYDRASMAHLLSLDLEPRLHRLLERRFAALVTAYGDVTDATEFFIVQSNVTEAEIEEELGYSPLEEPITGARFGSGGFQPYWDHLVRHDGWFEMAISYGSTFATIVLIEDAHGVLPDLRAMCESFT
jgi:hypothetical protein